MPEGYYVPFSAVMDAPYWHYKFGQGPKANNSAGIIPKVALSMCRTGGSLGRHPPERLPDGRGTDHRKDWRFPARAGADDEFLIRFSRLSGFLLQSSENANSMCVGVPSITLSSTNLWVIAGAYRLVINLKRQLYHAGS